MGKKKKQNKKKAQVEVISRKKKGRK